MNPGALLDALAEHLVVNRPKKKLGHKLMRDPLRFLFDDLAPILNDCGDWAVTGWAGLEMTAPYTNIVPSVQIYLCTEQLVVSGVDIFDKATIREVEEGGNIELWEMNTPLLAAPLDLGMPVINLPRLYVDLLSIGGRAKDGAEHLRETQIGY